MHALIKVRSILFQALLQPFRALPTPVQRFALFVWGLWQLAGELIHLVDVVTAYPYAAKNARR